MVLPCCGGQHHDDCDGFLAPCGEMMQGRLQGSSPQGQASRSASTRISVFCAAVVRRGMAPSIGRSLFSSAVSAVQCVSWFQAFSSSTALAAAWAVQRRCRTRKLPEPGASVAKADCDQLRRPEPTHSSHSRPATKRRVGDGSQIDQAGLCSPCHSDHRSSRSTLAPFPWLWPLTLWLWPARMREKGR